MGSLEPEKPKDYAERRKWQDAQIERKEYPECGRMACTNAVVVHWVNKYTPLLYCASCAAEINKHNPGLCYKEE